MSGRTKRRLEDFDPNASDPNDSDFDERAARPQKRSKKVSSSSSKPRRPQRRRTYDSDDIVDDEDDLEMDDSFGSAIETEEEIETNERGRAVRKATKKEIKYEEDSDDEEDDSDQDDDDEDELPSRPRRGKQDKPGKQTLIVKLKVNTNNRRTRGNKAPSKSRSTPGPETAGSRRSSRLSHEAEQPLVSLSNSGKHIVLERGSSVDRETQDMPRRPSRATKGLKKPPSAIMEASQEESQSNSAQANPAAAIGNAQENAPVEDNALQADSEAEPDMPILTSDVQMAEISESVHGDEAMKPTADDDDDEEEEEGPVSRPGRTLRSRKSGTGESAGKSQKRAIEESSDFEPVGDEEKEDEDVSESDDAKKKGQGKSPSDDSVGRARRYPTRKSQRSRQNSDSDDDLDRHELMEEAEELAMDKARTRRSTRRQPVSDIAFDQPSLRSRGKQVDYRIYRPELVAALDEEDNAPAATPSRNRNRGGGGGAGWRSLFSTQGPFGGHDGPRALFGGADGAGAVGGIDSDSSEDENQTAKPSVGGAVGMTPTSAFRPNLHNNDPAQAKSGGPANLGKVSDRKALADSDPLGVDTTVTFDGVGGLDDHINQLKEMVMLPLLYPELFKNFNVTPPRGVLFHGPPGTGKTLLARALASSVSSGGQKVTFYMRKGADALSKWVGEAERQLRLLFEEARKNQPSIIFFDEIDGLAPVRSSKQEQIHASIVATLLALMDGMDGRGQVIVIGATNRPDSVDPALRRPGRFDREFYFPLPGVPARRAIIDIHTKGWEPPLKDPFKDQLAELTKGYGGADLRALCTEAALNAIQGTYPQIYKSNKKYIVDPNTIKVLAKDFMISVNKMIPSSERSAQSSAAPLPKKIEPLLREPFTDLTRMIDDVLPRKRKLTALEEAEYDDREDAQGFEREMMETEFQRARVFRPRLLVRGLGGMGQQYLSSALLNKLEGVFVQSFDLATLLEDSSRSPEAAVAQLFKEVKRHKPSVIYIPHVDIWYDSLPPAALSIFKSLLQSLRPDDSVLLLGMLEDPEAGHDKASEARKAHMVKDLFGYSRRNQYELTRPNHSARKEFFGDLISFIRLPPTHFTDPTNRKKRKLAQLELAPEKAPVEPTKEELKAQKKNDRLTLNRLKMFIQPVMDQIKQKYRSFRFPVIEERVIEYLYDEQDPTVVTTDLPQELRAEQGQLRPYELGTDKHGVPGLRETETGKFYYNLDITIIEKRLSNGYYKRPRDYRDDIRRMEKDWVTFGHPEKMIKAKELLSNVEVDMDTISAQQPALAAECDAVYERERARAAKATKHARPGVPLFNGSVNVPPHVSNVGTETTNGTGPIILGVPVPGRHVMPPTTPVRHQTSYSGISNGVTAGGNGAGVNSHPDEDTPMTDSQDHDNQTQAYGTQSGANTQTQKSQVSAHTHVAFGIEPHQLHNSASTTTSGQRTDRSNRYSTSNNTQSTNGNPSRDHPDFSMMQPPSVASIPDTQEFPHHASQQTNSQPSQSSQPPAIQVTSLPQQPTAINALLNDVAPNLVVDEPYLEQVFDRLAKNSSGLSVEQLEQVNAHLMDAIWRFRHDWNRTHIAEKVIEAFNEVIEDIQEMARLLPPSQDLVEHT
ncbi:AAA-domain-containing protein [Pseudovirgaria hyperparasitica]|uniref:AAA-domain-containing protein n=1 Tax=Pseudovirgaria hyperparasitica TaxID=470096 RepID=A0A6A6W1F8_9PEZI|nr:AAA-domain-containing protein [Pseudovirgaria hyperparasitica]KAF2756365.1 AAA-domain-containing protein [Pseudovirgaria hyperparasitica]